MLNPNDRSLYTDALTPPPGYVFDQAIGTTYTLDPTTLLTIPVHLGLAIRRKDLETDSIDLLGALRRVADQITVYAQNARIQVPSSHHALFSLLESMVVEAASPGGGAFHPKLWVLRFRNADDGMPVLRLLVLSRNLTADHSWDLCLQLEGEITRHVRTCNRPISGLIRMLPSLSINAMDSRRQAQAEELAAEVERTKWELPEGFDQVKFHVIDGQSWLPEKSDRLAVISPFVTAPALEALAKTTRQAEKAEILISRGEELDKLDRDPHEIFEQVSVLNDMAEFENEEDVAGRDMHGLHAKVFITEKQDKVRVYSGSANATTAALVGGHNVEVLAELVGNRVGGIDTLLSEEGIGEYLVSWEAGKKPPDKPEEEKAGEILERVRKALADAKLRVRCVEEAHSSQWRLKLHGDTAIDRDGVREIRAWPITVHSEQASSILDSMGQETIDLGGYPIQSVTGLIAFEISSVLKGVEEKRFTLNLPLDDLPEGRDAAILHAVLQDREGFMRYLLLLLGEIDGGLEMNFNGAGLAANGQWSIGGEGALPLLEEMTRAFSRDPAKLHEIRGIVEQLDSEADSAKIIPEDFRTLWKTFDKALGEVKK